MYNKIARQFRMATWALVALALSVTVSYADDAPRAPGRASPAQVKAMELWIHSLALQAATYAVPIVAMYNLRATISFGPDVKAPPNEIWRIENIATPEIAQKAGYVTPNVNVVYGFGFIDLGQQPLILHAPDSRGRYYMVQIVDMWTNAFAYVGGIATGYKGGTYALVGPGWHGKLPPGVTRIDCPTRWVEIQPRVYVKDEADLAAAEKVLHAITVTGLAQYRGDSPPPAVAYHYDVPRINPNVASSQMQFQDPLQFWEIFSAAMNENPPPKSEIASVLPVYQYLGIELGKQWKRTSVTPLVLQQMKLAAEEIGPTMNDSLPLGNGLANGWIIPPANLGMPGADYISRGIVAVFGLTSNTTAETIYYSGMLDQDSRPLTGARRYTMTLKEPMPYLKLIPPGFWSITMYDAATFLTVPNQLNRYALGSDSNLKPNADGSITVYVQHDDPGADKESNWLPAPAGPFYLILRNYAPAPHVVEALRDLATFQGPPPLVPAR
jgi:DNA sulfur modification protein DndE